MEDIRKIEIQELGDLGTAQVEGPGHIRLAWHTSRKPEATRELVLLDPKDYGNNPDDDTGSKVYDRVKELATILHELDPDSDDGGPRTLKCKGWYEDQARAQFYFVYHLPPECRSTSGGIEFLSLYETYKISKPSVGARIRLARSLAVTVLRLHERNWLHKGIRSGHVLFFPSHLGGRPRLDHARLVGFDYARRDRPNEYSEKPMDKYANLYRHLSALRKPTTTFRKIHDYYSLGVVLVEIACWKPMADLLAKCQELRGEECKEEDLKRVREILMRRDSLGGPIDVAFRMGDIYQGAVEACLSSNFSADDGPLLLQSFRQRVICELDKCVI